MQTPHPHHHPRQGLPAGGPRPASPAPFLSRGSAPACPICGVTGGKELLGAGMVDPQVLKNVNIDPEKYSGWAFGLGIERTAMFRYQIADMRIFYENDLRFLRQFSLKLRSVWTG